MAVDREQQSRSGTTPRFPDRWGFVALLVTRGSRVLDQGDVADWLAGAPEQWS
jgi:hypothetical protein